MRIVRGSRHGIEKASGSQPYQVWIKGENMAVRRDGGRRPAILAGVCGHTPACGCGEVLAYAVFEGPVCCLTCPLETCLLDKGKPMKLLEQNVRRLRMEGYTIPETARRLGIGTRTASRYSPKF
jgi:hypothetical protein